MSNTHNVPKRHDIHARARTLAADYITLRDLKSSDDPLWLEEDFDFGSSPSQGDSPLLFRFSIHQDDLRRLGLPRLPGSQCSVATYVRAEAGLTTLECRRLSYSRRADWYSRRPRYYGPLCTYRRVVNTVDALEGLNLVNRYRALPGDHLCTGLQSAVWLPDDVIAAILDVRIGIHQAHNPLILRARNEDRDLLTYVENNETRFLRKQINRFNDYGRASRFTLGDKVNYQRERVASMNSETTRAR